MNVLLILLLILLGVDADKPHQQKTLALIKPDAMQANHKQAIIDKILAFGFTIIQQKQLQFDLKQASLFYREHEHKSFYPQLTEWMSSAPIYAMVLEKENAIQDWRFLMGPTDANKAREINPTSIRALFGTDGSHNATHGSDCLTSAEREIDIVFN
ncbi:nucleoside-diphosphate kinase, partial [Chlamydoabsidia padenii]